MANLYYRNSGVRVSTSILDINNNPVGVATSSVYFYLKYPNNIVYSNDPNITIKSPNSIYDSSIQVKTQTLGTYYVDYTFAQIGNYQYKFQVYSLGTSNVISAISGDISILDDGVF